MSDIISVTPLCLEMLPDEILLEIFQYIKSMDLLGFQGHNQRFNNVIRDVTLKIVIKYPEDEEENHFDNLMNFSSRQILSLELRYGWKNFNFNTFQELRSLTLNCIYLSSNQLDQLFTITLQYLERVSINDVPYHIFKELLFVMLNNEHFPSLITVQFAGEFPTSFEINDHSQLPHNTIRSLVLSQWYGLQLAPLFDLLPNLHRFESNLDKVTRWPSKINKRYMSLMAVRVRLHDVLKDLDKMLRLMPNLRRLHVKGKIREKTVLEHFKKLIKIIHSRTPYLQRFDCEFRFPSSNSQIDSIILQHLDPLFIKIQCLLKYNGDYYYTTDLTEYLPEIEHGYLLLNP